MAGTYRPISSQNAIKRRLNSVLPKTQFMSYLTESWAVKLGATYTAAYLVTLSARISMTGGIVMPSWLAVFRFMNSLNFVGCCTGRTAGFAPFKILST